MQIFRAVNAEDMNVIARPRHLDGADALDLRQAVWQIHTAREG
jgi:hypothetical protein